MLICVIIPHYDHIDQFRKWLPRLVQQGFPLVIVDDASPQPVFDQLSQLVNTVAPGSILVRHAKNLGKGGAVITGLNTAREAGFTHAIQIDADGQHDLGGIARLVEETTRNPAGIICGKPQFDESISKLRFYSRYITLVLVRLETLSTEIRDALCGFRSYPLQTVTGLIKHSNPGKRMAFDPEILVRAVWAGIPLHFVPVRTSYPADGKSHFRYVRDNFEIAWMHTRLIAGMLLRLPVLVWRLTIRISGRANR
jgi:glycosyltransferase involved in cell wall biosynthesis